MSTPSNDEHVADPTALDWDRSDRDYELIRDDRLIERTPDPDTLDDRYQNWLAGETS